MTTSRPRLGFVGAGTMARGLARGIHAAGLAGAITAHDPVRELLDRFCAEVGATPAADNGAVACNAEILFLAVKPQHLQTAAAELAAGGVDLADRLVVSIAAGVTLARLAEWLPGARLIRVMPNLPCVVGEMAAGFARGPSATEEDARVVGDLLRALGVALEVDEGHLNAVTALSGSGPAFMARLLQAFIDAGEACGLPRDAARALTLQTAKGTAALLQEYGYDTADFIDMVSSPGGTTVAGRAVLESSDLHAVIAETIAAATKRGRELAGNVNTMTTQAITTQTMEQAARSAREASRRLRTMPAALRDAALRAIAREIDANRLTIQAANARDLERARADGIPQPLIYRLGLSDRKMEAIDASLQDVAAAPDPLQQVQVARQLDEGLTLTRVAVPIGVLGVIFESRPDALVQIASLCIKSGNAAILKGGSEAAESNRALFDGIQAALTATDPRFAGALHLATSRDQIDDLLRMDDLVDLIIPRGSPELVRSIQDRTRIAVLGHADGICHVYVDAAADLEQALAIVIDAKTEYPAVCNAAETVLVHADVAGRLLPRLQQSLPQVELRGDDRTCALIDVPQATEADWDTEYLDLILAIRVVDDLQEAIAFINRHGSGHTDAIVTTDRQAADAFFAQVDSASVLCNCSTRFADGYRFGLGAEVGISTTRIHARGPVGVEGLTTYAYRLQGDGHVVADYTSGARSFHHRDLPSPPAATADGRT